MEEGAADVARCGHGWCSADEFFQPKSHSLLTALTPGGTEMEETGFLLRSLTQPSHSDISCTKENHKTSPIKNLKPLTYV